MSSKIVFLDYWPLTFRERAWVNLKIFLKEGLWHRQLHTIYRLGKPYGSRLITEQTRRALESSGVELLDKSAVAQGHDKVVVFRDVRNLRWALSQKKAGKIKVLFAGPFIATLPSEANSILLDSDIDGLIFLSDWHRNLFLREAAVAPRSTHIWYAGVDSDFWQPALATTDGDEEPRDQVLIYLKYAPDKAIELVKNELTKRGYRYNILVYGQYNTIEYRAALQRAPFVVFLHETETQGLATLEAWSMNRPTLHWNPGIMRFLGNSYQGGSSSPYLTAETGMSFVEWSEFAAKLDLMISAWPNLNPRQVILNKFTWSQSAEIFKSIVQIS
jgi:glycosyltransferase involved in cell wall biosynthesis